MDDPSPSSSSYINKVFIPINANEKVVLLNVLKYIEKTLKTYPHRSEVIKATARIMGISHKTIYRILGELKTSNEKCSSARHTSKHSKRKKVDAFTRNAIRRKVHEFYYAGDSPTFEKVLNAINKDENLPSFKKTTLITLAPILNFYCLKRYRRNMLVDRPDVQIWRRKYLQQIRDFRRENRKIYYLDETWIHKGHTMTCIWDDNDIENSRQAFLRNLSILKKPSKDKCLMITHIGSDEGFLKDALWILEAKKNYEDYDIEMDPHNFEKWFELVLTKIEPGSVVVMDDAPHHSRKLEVCEKIPNIGWQKSYIQQWLTEKEIKFTDTDCKAELLSKIQKDKYIYDVKYVDRVANLKNITVCWLPPYHCDLNPIAIIWAKIKSYVGRHNKNFKMAELKFLVEESIRRIGKNEWVKCIDHVIKEEENMMRLDDLIDSATTSE